MIFSFSPGLLNVVSLVLIFIFSPDIFGLVTINTVKTFGFYNELTLQNSNVLDPYCEQEF